MIYFPLLYIFHINIFVIFFSNMNSAAARPGPVPGTHSLFGWVHYKNIGSDYSSSALVYIRALHICFWSVLSSDVSPSLEQFSLLLRLLFTSHTITVITTQTSCIWSHALANCLFFSFLMQVFHFMFVCVIFSQSWSNYVSFLPPWLCRELWSLWFFR